MVIVVVILPLIVITFAVADQVAVTPEGKPVGVPIPVAPVVDIVIEDIGEEAQDPSITDGVGLTKVLFGHEITVILPVAFTLPQPPVKGIV